MSRYAIAAGVLVVAIGSAMGQAQQTTPGQGQRMQGGMTMQDTPKSPAQMKEQCQMTMREMQSAKNECEQADRQLEQQVQKIKQAQGQEKIDAMASALEMMAQQRKQANERAEAMMPRLMQHMQMHMAMASQDPQQGQQAMAQCPMMHASEGGARPAGEALP